MVERGHVGKIPWKAGHGNTADAWKDYLPRSPPGCGEHRAGTPQAGLIPPSCHLRALSYPLSFLIHKLAVKPRLPRRALVRIEKLRQML